MNYKNARDALRRYRESEKELKKAELEVKKFLERIDDVASITGLTAKWDAMPHTSGVSHPTEDMALRREQLLNTAELGKEFQKLNGKVVELIVFRQKMEEAFNSCRQEEADVVVMHWLKNTSMEQVAVNQNIAIRTAWRYENKVLYAICKIFGY